MTTARKLALLLLSLDFVVVIAVFNALSNFRYLAAHFVRNESLLVTLETVGTMLKTPAGATFSLVPYLMPFALIIFAIYLIDGFNPRTDMMSLDYTSVHVIAIGASLLTTLLVTYVIISSDFALHYSRWVPIVSFAVIAPVTLSYRRMIHQRLVNRHGQRSFVFLGDRQACLAFREECRRLGTTQPVVYCVSSDSSAGPFSPDIGELKPFGEVIEQVQRGEIQVEAIVLRESGRDLEADLSRRLVSLYFHGVPTFTLELFHQVYWRKIPLYRLNQTWLFQEGFQIAREPVFERVKRIGDVTLSTLGLILASPFIAIAAIAVRLGDGGPAFFCQTRVGRNHAKFTLYKLRTMRAGADSGPLYTATGDARITRIGRFLRASRLDELPQLWNVIRGEMSLIGPRAEWDRLVDEYESKIPCYYFRHLVKPGITGWAQVNYRYGANIEDTLRKLEYDLFYIRYFSFTLDASIVLKTIHIMLFGKGR